MIIALTIVPIGVCLWALCRAHRIASPPDVLEREDREQKEYVSVLR